MMFFKRCLAPSFNLWRSHSQESKNSNQNNRKHRLLATFDFDKTIIKEDSYRAVAQLLTPEQRTAELESLIKESGWIAYIRHVLRVLQRQQNLRATQIGQHVRRLPAIPGMLPLLHNLAKNPKMDMCILSDANCFFIREWLTAHNLNDIFSAIYTNPTKRQPNDQLIVEPFEHQTNCDQCPDNLCKGSVIKALIHSDDIDYKRIIYVGDSCNDLCAIRCLRENDVACIRRGQELHNKLPAHKHELSCIILKWTDGYELQRQLDKKSALK